MIELKVEAKLEKLADVRKMINKQLDSVKCTTKVKNQIDIAIEEIFVNIANYAYAPESGMVAVQVETINESSITITFIDNGKPYNPLKKTDPDITLSAEKRQIGGLGIFLVKKSMDMVTYKYQYNQNIISMTKKF